METAIEFIKNNWSDLSLILVGLSAVWIYKAQEKGKLRDAASLIILQIDELQTRVQELQSYITEKGLNFSAFYESLPLMDVNHWSKYKHLFIRKIDNKSYNRFNKFFQYITCMQEQQELLRNLQNNYFFVKQSAISNVEFQYICETLKEVENSIVSLSELIDLAAQEWEDSDVYEYFSETKFLFVVYKRLGHEYILKGATLWNMPAADLDGPVKKGWESVQRIIKKGVRFTINPNGTISNNLPGKNDNPIIHIRPHATKSAYRLNNGVIRGNVERDANPLPDGQWMTTQSFWINNSYILEQLPENLVRD